MKAFETTIGPKQQVRNLLCSHAAKLPTVRKIFTLPSREALCYYTFKQKFPTAAITCIENQKDIVKILHEKDIECQHTDIKTYANNVVNLERHHDVVFLDYYSFLSAGILEEIKAFIGNDNIIHQGKPTILGITLMKGMRQNKQDTLDLLSKYRWKGYRTGTENTLKAVSEGVCGFLDIEFEFTDIKLLESVEYSASKGSTPMYFLLFKLLK